MKLVRNLPPARRPISLVILIASFIGLSAMPGSTQDLPDDVDLESGGLVPNGGFDVGNRAGHPVGWGVEGHADGADIVNLQACRSAGIASLRIDDQPGSAVSVRSERITAEPGVEYTLTAKVRGQSGTPAWLYLEFWDFEGKRLSAPHVEPEFSTDWQPVTVTATAPPGTVHVTPHIYGSTDAAGVSCWDEVELTAAPQTYDSRLGDKRELFLDNYRIAEAHNVGRITHPAKITKTPVIEPDKPWEHSSYIYGSVYVINGLYRMWYTCHNDQEPFYHLCYAESSNGTTWRKPHGRGDVGYQDIPPERTNIVFAGGGTVAYNPDAAKPRRYALLTFKSGVPNETLGYYAYFSPDGYSWTSAQDKPVLLDGDVSNVSYDPETKRYIATIKKRMFTSRTPGTYERSAFVATSQDFLNWTEPRLAVMGDFADDGRAEAIGGLEGQVYGMPVMPYESTYVGFPWMFSILNFTSGQYASAADGPVDVQIASSRDLTRWSRPVRDPVIEAGLPGAWNDGAHYTASNLLVDDGRILLYYGAFNNGHGGAEPDNPGRRTHVGQIGLAMWRRDGWVSITNGAVPGYGTPGEVTTKPILIEDDTLHLNATTRPGGSIRVEVLTDDGDPIPGFTRTQANPVRGDQLAAKVTWSSGKTLRDLEGREVRLRFTLLNADLYSYWIN